jgi:hypothetical protein
MPRVSWDKAEADLDGIAPDVADQLKHNAEEILHNVPPLDVPGDEGELDDGIMWHRGSHERVNEDADGPQDYLLLYRKREFDTEFEILAVPSNKQVASKWVRMIVTVELSDLTDMPPL